MGIDNLGSAHRSCSARHFHDRTHGEDCNIHTMPPRKEQKETVVYAASKRKALPFKPQRPSKVPRVPTTESETSTAPPVSRRPTSVVRGPSSFTTNKKKDKDLVDENEDDSDEDLADDPLAQRPSKSITAGPSLHQRQTSRQHSPPPTISDDDDEDLSTAPPLTNRRTSGDDVVPLPSQNESPSIPQPLIVRLLHEHFSDKSTKIDKHAIQVLQKYLEVFVREAIARTALQKKQDPGVSALDSGWLELEDLEKVAAGMMLDF